MYTSFIGNRFLELYNRERKKKLSAQEYFEKEHFPLFYDHPQYLQSPANTPLFQVIAQKKTKDSKARQKAYTEIVEKIKAFSTVKDNTPDMSFALGFASADLMGTTSGQVTSMELPFKEEDMYASWIGAGFGIGVGGGTDLLIEQDDVLIGLHEGWELYREFVNQNKDIDNKIETWNGIWFVHRFGDSFDPQNPTANFHPIGTGKDGKAKMERPSWIKVIFILSRMYRKQKLNSYLYHFSQMNQTIGFIVLDLPDVFKMYQFYPKVFAPSIIKSNAKLEELYLSELKLEDASTLGVIGLKAIEPKDLRKFMAEKKENKKVDEITFFNYKLWITAMINNEELLDLASQSAKMLFEYFDKSDSGTRNKREQIVKVIMDSRKRESFFESLNSLSDQDIKHAQWINNLKNKVMLKIPQDNVRLFVTLIKMDYNAIKFENTTDKNMKEKK